MVNQVAPKIILSAGAFRSGSTWLYNAIRLILLAGGARVSAGWVDDVDVDAAGAEDYLIIKLHEPNEMLANRAWRIFTSHRDLRDVARSASDFLRVTENDALLRYAEVSMKHHTYWVEHAHYDMSYESMKLASEKAIQEIAQLLDVHLSSSDIAGISKELDSLPEPKGADKYDSTSLLHPEHRFGGEAGGWSKKLTTDQAQLITGKFLPWMCKYGYVSSAQALAMLAQMIIENPQDESLRAIAKDLLVLSPAVAADDVSSHSPQHALLESRLAAAENLLLTFLNYFKGSLRSSEWMDALKKKSVAQLGQDLWVLEQTHYKQKGFFVEFGATDGVSLSNTYLLEKEFGWEGILAEPNPDFYRQLQGNRHCIISDACIAGETGREVEFVLADVYGGMSEYADMDMHAATRQTYMESGKRMKVVTTSLHDFLIQNNAPHKIDYMSIDTEGSELEILAAFPFEKWDIGLFTIEHNFTPQREQIRSIMQAHGYRVVEREWDDWYVRASPADASTSRAEQHVGDGGLASDGENEQNPVGSHCSSTDAVGGWMKGIWTSEANRFARQYIEHLGVANSERQGYDYDQLILILDQLAGPGIVKAIENRDVASPELLREQSDRLCEDGEVHFGEGETEAAAISFLDAIKVDPTSPRAFNNLGVMLWGSGEQEMSASYFAKALNVCPEDRTTVLNFGEAMESMGKYAAAEAAYLKFMIAYPDDAEIVGHYLALPENRNVQGADHSATTEPIPVTPENFSEYTYSRRSHFSRLRIHESQRNENIDDCNLKVYQDTLAYNFILDNFPEGSKLLDIGGGDSRIIRWLKDRYEFWNLDKLEGLGNGLTDLGDTSGFRLVRDYIGAFSKELPDGYFDGIFSISTLEHVPEDDPTLQAICDDMDRLLKPGGLSMHCFDVLVKRDGFWIHRLVDYFHGHEPIINPRVPNWKMRVDPDLWGMTKQGYDRVWMPVTKIEYETFGMPISYNVMWRKAG